MQITTLQRPSHPPRFPSALAVSTLVSVATLGTVLASAPAHAGAARFFDTGVIDAASLTPGWTTTVTPSGTFYSSIIDDKKFTISSNPVTFLSGNMQEGDISFHSPTFNVYTGLLSFRDPATNLGLAGPSTGTFEYTVEILNPAHHFDQAWLSSVVEWPGAATSPIQVQKKIDYLDIAAPDVVIGPSVNGSSTPITNLIPSQKLKITDTWNIPATGKPTPFGPTTPVLRSYVNSYTQAPGPLPVLGAGAAFGFSRKLRGRVRQARGI
jgi:hypothetical protein